MKIFKVIQIQWESTARLAISLVQELKIIEMSFLIQFVVVFIFDNFNLDSALDFQLLFFYRVILWLRYSLIVKVLMILFFSLILASSGAV